MNDQLLIDRLKPAMKDGSISGLWKIEDISLIFPALTGLNFKYARTRKRQIIFFVVLLIGIIPVTIILAFLPVSNDARWTVLIAYLVLFLAVTVIAIIGKKLTRLKPDDRIFPFVKSIISYLKEDIPEGSEVDIQFSLKPLNSDIYLKGKGDNYKKGKYYKCNDYSYQRIFFSLKARLYDGNTLAMVNRDSMKLSVMNKKSPKGKQRTKTRFKRRADFSVRLRINRKSYTCSLKPGEELDRDGKKIVYSEEGGHPMLVMAHSEISSGTSPGGIKYPGVLDIIGNVAMLYSLLVPVEGKRGKKNAG